MSSSFINFSRYNSPKHKPSTPTPTKSPGTMTSLMMYEEGGTGGSTPGNPTPKPPTMSTMIAGEEGGTLPIPVNPTPTPPIGHTTWATNGGPVEEG